VSNWHGVDQPQESPWVGSMMKRVLDISVALIGIILLIPLFAVVALLVKLDSAGPVLFRQKRMGRGFSPFLIYKFRSMVIDADRRGGAITGREDPRITRIGRVLRNGKIDELPQLFNVLKGDMSLVGPRPEVPKYAEMFRGDFVEILQARPGITDLASLKYRDEAEILGRSENPENAYIREILPDKIRLAKEYIGKSSIQLDLRIILQTLAKLVSRSSAERRS
jgi:lipopolysaccharide/colanic/teichoic acid biosynthesis glycosyltransferase